jgi:glycosyltransferase involved in cell wall biosynthesis
VRVVHVSDCYAPRLGGIETQVRALATRQAAAGHDVQVITATAAGDGTTASGSVTSNGGATVRGHSTQTGSSTELLDGVQVHRLVSRAALGLPLHPHVAREIRAALSPGGGCANPDIVHVHGGVVSPFAYPAADVAADLGLPTVITIHGVWGPLMVPLAALADRLMHWSDWGVLVTAVSEAAAAPIRRAAPSLEVQLVPNGIDVQGWAVTPIERPYSVVRLLAVMRLAPRKRGIPLVRMLSAASARMPLGRTLELTVVGEGPTKNLVERYAARVGVARQITFTGRVTPAEVRVQLAKADVFIAPATRESFGIAALEARTAGLPVLALDGTGMESFIRDGVEGLLAGDDNQFVDNIVRIALDDDLRDGIAAHNRTVPPAQAWPAVLARVQELYAQAIAARAD